VRDCSICTECSDDHPARLCPYMTK
jgi:hypothetical protein